MTGGTWETPLAASGKPAGLSHISFYDTKPVPVPAAIPLFLSGMAALGVMARRRQAS